MSKASFLFSERKFKLVSIPGGYFHIRRSGGGGLDLTSSSEAKFGQGQQSSPNKRKNLETSVITRRKSWGKIPILGSNLKFRGQDSGICHLNFWRQILGPSPSDLPIWKYPPGVFVSEYTKTGKSMLRPDFKQSNRKTASLPFILIEITDGTSR